MGKTKGLLHAIRYRGRSLAAASRLQIAFRKHIRRVRVCYLSILELLGNLFPCFYGIFPQSLNSLALFAHGHGKQPSATSRILFARGGIGGPLSLCSSNSQRNLERL